METESNAKCSLHNILIIYLLFFCLLRILLAIKNGYAIMWGDEITYWQISQSLFEEGKTILRNVPIDLFSCLYSWSISWVHIFRDYDVQFLAVYILNAVMMTSFLVPFYMLCRRMLNHDGMALLLTVLISILPEFSYTTRIITENLFFPISMWTFYLVYKVFENDQINFRSASLLGFSSFLCFWTRSAGICVFLSLCTYFIWSIIFESSRKKKILSMLYTVVIFLILYVVFSAIYKSVNSEITTSNIYKLTFMQAFNIHNLGNWIQGGLRYLLIFAVITGFFSLALPVAIFQKLEKKDKRFFVFALLVLSWAVMESVGMYYVSEGMDRIHIRYISYLIPVAILFFTKSCMLLKQCGKRLIRGQAVFLSIYCVIGLFIAIYCGFFFNTGSTIDAVSAIHLTKNNGSYFFNLIIAIFILIFVISNLILMLRGRYYTVLQITFICFAFVEMRNSIISYTQSGEIKQNYAMEDIEYKQIDEYILHSIEDNAKVAFMNENYWGRPIEIHVSARGLSAIPLDQCIPLIEKQTATLKDNRIPYVGLLVESELGEIPDYIIMKKSLFEEMGIASYRQVFATDNYYILKKEDELFRFAIPAFSYTVEGTSQDNWITKDDAIFHLTSDAALDKITIYMNYLPGTKLCVADSFGNEEIIDLDECGGVLNYIIDGMNQKDIELKLYGEVTQKPMDVLPDSTDSRDLCANIVDVSIVCKQEG